jgi:hypothetical protein
MMLLHLTFSVVASHSAAPLLKAVLLVLAWVWSKADFFLSLHHRGSPVLRILNLTSGCPSAGSLLELLVCCSTQHSRSAT